MNKSFRNIRKFINIRNLCFFIFKICVAILLTISLAIASFIIVFSIKPRVVPKISSYIIQYINMTNPDANANFDIKNTTLHFDSNLGLKYKIKDFKLRTKNSQISLSEIAVNLDFVRLLFGKVVINNINTINSNIKYFLKEENIKEEILATRESNKIMIAEVQKDIQKFFKSSLSIKNFNFNNAEINIILDGINNKINILKFQLSLDLKNNNLKINQNAIFNINNNKINSKININCNKENKIKTCKIDIDNITPNSIKTFFGKQSEEYNYLSNTNGNFDGKFDLIFDKRAKLEQGNGIIKSKFGSFNFKNLFDEKLLFGNLIMNFSFDNYLENININSLTTNFGKNNFFMSMFIQEKSKYKNIDLNFDIKNALVSDLRKLWPNFLGNEGSRPWVLAHIKSGSLPNAKANMNFKYFKENNNKNSGLQSINAEIDLNNVLLNYSKYFPIIENINGKAIFTKKEMKINIDSANVLKSKLKNGKIGIKFHKNPTDVIIQTNLVGPLADLFIHIDKNDETDIKNIVNSILEDYRTFTNLNIEVPLIENINFNNVVINTKSIIFNKKNSLLTEDSKIDFSFNKPKNSNSFSGKIDLTNENLEYLPLNIVKPKDLKFSLNYSCDLNGSIVYIKDIKPNSDLISFIANGFLNTKDKINEINVENISYNNSNYNLYYKSNTTNGIFNNNVEIDGRNISYSNIFERLKNNKNSIHTKESNAKNKTTVQLNLKYLSFENEKKLQSPILLAELENNEIRKIDFNAKIDDSEFVKIIFNKKQKMLNTKSNNFGDLFQTIGLTDTIIGGDGEINFNQMTENGKSVIYGDIDIGKQFKIITDENANKDLIPNIKEEKYFKRLTESLVEESSIRFDKMRGNISYSNNVLKFDEIVANSSFVNLQILASGFLNFETKEMNIKGLLMPLGTINGLFGANRLPVISNLIFGQKNAGLFASMFEISKADKNSKLEFKTDKFSMIMPGFIRNIFNLDTYKNIYRNTFN